MAAEEFDIIRQYFSPQVSDPRVILAGGDDCAILKPPPDRELVITCDTLISGVHFPETTAPADIAHKALMVNLSDLAAMGAEPAWITLAISLPGVDHDWLRTFSDHLHRLLAEHGVSLIGGDTTRGPLSISLQATGFVEPDRALRRDKARPGEDIWVTGYPGIAAVGLAAIQQGLRDVELQACIERLNRPDARIAFARELPAYSACAIDISDGLIADLGHILEASGCGAEIRLSDIPLPEAVQYYMQTYCEQGIDWPLLLTRGDDYELCFTAAPEHRKSLEALANKHQLPLSCIGSIEAGDKLRCLDSHNKRVNFSQQGYQHFQQ